MINNGWELIREERRRQIEDLGITEEYDRRWAGGELLRAAGCYVHDVLRCLDKKPGRTFPLDWPWGSKSWHPLDKDHQIRELTKAGALIAAEIDRIQNSKTPKSFEAFVQTNTTKTTIEQQ